MSKDWGTYRKLFDHPSPDFERLPFAVRCMSAEVIRRCDRNGRIVPGDALTDKLVSDLEFHVRAHTGEGEFIRRGVEFMLRDGYLVFDDGYLTIRNFVKAQRKDSAERMAKKRGRDGCDAQDDSDASDGSDARDAQPSPREDETRLDETRSDLPSGSLPSSPDPDLPDNSDQPARRVGYPKDFDSRFKPALIAWATKKHPDWPPWWLENRLECMRDTYIAKGLKFSDWTAAARKYLASEVGYNRGPAQLAHLKPKPSPADVEAERLAREAALEKRIRADLASRPEPDVEAFKKTGTGALWGS